MWRQRAAMCENSLTESRKFTKVERAAAEVTTAKLKATSFFFLLFSSCEEKGSLNQKSKRRYYMPTSLNTTTLVKTIQSIPERTFARKANMSASGRGRQSPQLNITITSGHPAEINISIAALVRFIS